MVTRIDSNFRSAASSLLTRQTLPPCILEPHMKKFKYEISEGISPDSIWVCEACKKNNSEKILLKQWRLVAHRDDETHPCHLCARGEAAGE